MRGFVTGGGPDGRSRVEREVQLTDASVRNLWVSATGAPTLGLDLSKPDTMDLGVAPGGMRWAIVNYAPGQESPMHWTRTLDFDAVVRGSVTLNLDEGSIELTPGDCVVLPGVRHGWRAGPEGCTFTCAIHGVEG